MMKKIKKIKKVLLWYYMLNKRLFRKRGFVILLCLIPILVWGMQMISKEESGIMTVYLCAEDPEDPMTAEIVEKLKTAESVVRYVEADEETACNAVEQGKADCAWIFRDDFRNRLDRYASGTEKEKGPLIYIVAIEDNVALQLMRTYLYGVFYDHYAYYLCENFIRGELVSDGAVSEEELRADFDKTAVEEKLFQAVYISQDEIIYSDTIQRQESYLLQPIKGILLILITICGLASSVYYLQDESKGIFAWIPPQKRIYFAAGYHITAMSDAAFVVLLSLYLLQGKAVEGREILLMLLYVAACTAFCNLVMVLCRNTVNLGRCIPLIALLMLVLCPVFLDFGLRFGAPYLFPATYYLRALYDRGMYLCLAGYTAVCAAAGMVLHKLTVK